MAALPAHDLARRGAAQRGRARRTEHPHRSVQGRDADRQHHAADHEGSVGALLNLHVPLLPAQLARVLLPRLRSDQQRVRRRRSVQARNGHVLEMQGIRRHASRRRVRPSSRHRNSSRPSRHRRDAGEELRRDRAGDRSEQQECPATVQQSRIHAPEAPDQILPERRRRFPPEAHLHLPPRTFHRQQGKSTAAVSGQRGRHSGTDGERGLLVDSPLPFYFFSHYSTSFSTQKLENGKSFSGKKTTAKNHQLGFANSSSNVSCILFSVWPSALLPCVHSERNKKKNLFVCSAAVLLFQFIFIEQFR